MKNLGKWAAPLFASWLLAGYLLPNTVWQDISAISFIPQIALGTASAKGFICVLLLAVAVWISYFRYVTFGSVRALWLLMLVFAGVYAVTGVAELAVGQDVSPCSLMLITWGIGLLIARLCGSVLLIAHILSLLGLYQACCTVYYYFITKQDVFLSGTIIRAGGTFHHPTPIYTMMLFCIPFAIGLAIRERSSRLQIFYWIVSFIMLLALTCTWYRGGLMALTVAISWVAFRLMSWPRAALLISPFLLCTVFAFCVRVQGPANRTSSEGSLKGRYLLWEGGLKAFTSHPLTGVGVTCLEVPVYWEKNKDIELSSQYHEPENILILVLGEMGISGAIILIMFVVLICRIIGRSDSEITTVIGAIWLALLIAGLSDTPIGTVDRVAANILAGVLFGATMMIVQPNQMLLCVPALEAKDI